MRKKIYSLLIGILVVVLLAVVGWIIDYINDYFKADTPAAAEAASSVSSAGNELISAPTVFATAELLTEATDAPASNVTSGYSGPVLPGDDISGNDLFKDGIAIVKLDFGIDGDTAAFIVNGKSYHVRMLAIDTPEVDEEFATIRPMGQSGIQLHQKCTGRRKADCAGTRPGQRCV